MKKIIISLLVIISLSFSYSNEANNKLMPYDQLLDTAIVHIKYHEGFRGNAYSDSQGYQYIGYGHHLLKGEAMTNITKEQADKLLRKDLHKIQKVVKKLSPEIEGNKLLAMTLFSYNFGTGYYMGSSLRTKVNTRQKIDNVILTYCRLFNSSKTLVKSEKLYQRRQFELWLYNYYDTGIKK